MAWARLAHCSVERDSVALMALTETVLTITVWLLPPRLSSSSWVSFESRYGMCPPLASDNAAITLPSAESDRLILTSSRIKAVSSSAPEALARSEPARSTRLSFERSLRACTHVKGCSDGVKGCSEL
eukprot:scaffold116569_cov51-Phaeocystis_antarctica.AAC.1